MENPEQFIFTKPHTKFCTELKLLFSHSIVLAKKYVQVDYDSRVLLPDVWKRSTYSKPLADNIVLYYKAIYLNV